MDQEQIERIEDLGRDDLLDFLLEMFHRSWMHYGLWFHAARDQMEPDRFAQAERLVFRQGFALSMKRLAKVFGFAVDERGLPAGAQAMDRQELAQAARALAANWYANDGIWFQAIEAIYDMDLAKRANDSVWARFAPYEAEQIRLRLGLDPACGLQGLRAALPLRSAALINAFGYEWDQEGALIVRVAQCRVQAARARRGLPDYPCKSAGQVEHQFFARALDGRIRTQCLACPPDEHPPQWYCTWRFTLEG
jgi:hypothetical protein